MGKSMTESFDLENESISIRKVCEGLGAINVLIAGHTGFTGSWLGFWLTNLGCSVTGVGLQPHTQPNLFDDAGLADLIQSRIADIRD
jgi:CDP-glucose 4,6-dehydratase